MTKTTRTAERATLGVSVAVCIGKGSCNGYNTELALLTYKLANSHFDFSGLHCLVCDLASATNSDRAQGDWINQPLIPHFSSGLDSSWPGESVANLSFSAN